MSCIDLDWPTYTYKVAMRGNECKPSSQHLPPHYVTQNDVGDYFLILGISSLLHRATYIVWRQ